MGATKFENYSNDIITVAEFFKAFSNPARLKALLIIANDKAKNTTQADIQKKVKLSQSTISYHLKTIRDAGLISTAVKQNKEGRCCINYRLVSETLSFMKKLLDHFIESVAFQSTFENTNNRYYKKILKVDDWELLLNEGS